MASNVKIKDWKKDERPREKLISKGASSLTDSELLSILIRTGSSDKNAVEVSRNMLDKASNSLNSLSQFSLQDLIKVKGIGSVKAVSIVASFELAIRLASEIPEEKPVITSSASVLKILSPMLRSLPHEECWVLFLNRGNRMIAKERVSVGGISSTVMDSRLIIKKAVNLLASSIIIVHNHPSGNPYPGEQDKRQTRLLKEAAALFDISLIDHIIIAGDKHYSFSDGT